MLSPSASTESYEGAFDTVTPSFQNRNIKPQRCSINECSPTSRTSYTRPRSLHQTPTATPMQAQPITREPQALYDPCYYSQILNFYHSPNQIDSNPSCPVSDERASSTAATQNPCVSQRPYYSQHPKEVGRDAIWPRNGSFSGSSDSATSTTESESASSKADSIEMVQPSNEYAPVNVPTGPLQEAYSSTTFQEHANQLAGYTPHYYHYPAHYTYYPPHLMFPVNPGYPHPYVRHEYTPSLAPLATHNPASSRVNQDHLMNPRYHDQVALQMYSSHVSWNATNTPQSQQQQTQAPLLYPCSQINSNPIPSQIYDESPATLAAPVIGLPSTSTSSVRSSGGDHRIGCAPMSSSDTPSDKTVSCTSTQNVYPPTQVATAPPFYGPPHPYPYFASGFNSDQRTLSQPVTASSHYPDSNARSTITSSQYAATSTAPSPPPLHLETKEVHPHSLQVRGSEMGSQDQMMEERELEVDEADGLWSSNGNNKVRRPWPCKYEAQILSEEDLKLPAVKRRRIYINSLEQYCNQIQKSLKEHGLSSPRQPLPTWGKSRAKDTKLSVVRFQHEINLLRNRLSYLNSKQASSGSRHNNKAPEPSSLSPHPHAAEGP
ncbi:hypothetical protein FS842_005828 [Serendipita sp. 407]|nr:hypothetical protein FS842_005828 [Serendipita sp. 407]